MAVVGKLLFRAFLFGHDGNDNDFQIASVLDQETLRFYLDTDWLCLSYQVSNDFLSTFLKLLSQ